MDIIDRNGADCALSADEAGSDMDQDLKLREATELVGAYLASQPDAERATAAFGALRMSIVVLWETSGRDVARQVLSGMAESLELLEHPSSH